MNICLVGPLFYDSDNRTMRYAETLCKRGHEVDVVAVGRPGEPRYSCVNGVHVYRIQTRERNERGRFSYLLKLVAFLLNSGLFLTLRHFKRRYRVIHVHSIPDFEVFAALMPKLMGAGILLDVYDVTPEFYLSKFQATKASWGYRMLMWVERVSCAFADHIIAANHLWRDLLTSRSVPSQKCSAFINYLDTALFAPRERSRTDDRFVIIYPGVLNWHQGLDIAVRAFHRVRQVLPKAEFHIYGEGNEKGRLEQLIRDLGLVDSVHLREVVPLREVPLLLANADVGVVAKRADVFGNEAYSTKILEYMSQSLPAVIPRTKIDTYYFPEDAVRFFEPGNVEDMAAKILEVAADEPLRERLIAAGRKCVAQYTWAVKEEDYLNLINHLAGAPCDSSRVPVV